MGLNKKDILFFFGCSLFILTASFARQIKVCPDCEIRSVQKAIDIAFDGDEILIHPGVYKEHDIEITKSLTIKGIGNPVIDGENLGTVFHISANNFSLQGITIINVGKSFTKDFAGILVARSSNFLIKNVVLKNVFFGILVEKSKHGTISYNKVSSNAVSEASSGNGIHLWHCDHMQVDHNNLSGLRDGIYFEFVKESKIFKNHSYKNLRYGLHFMFSNNNAYYDNEFVSNGVGVAVMFSKFIDMRNNLFTENWGSASYGLLLKEIYDAKIENNRFTTNTVGVSVDGSTRVNFEGNTFARNGWAINVIGACYENTFTGNNFMHNSFDLAHSGNVNSNSFDKNYWSDYTGYDLDGNGIGDVPYRPVKLFSYITNRSPEAIVLLRSLFVDIINFSEKVSPVFTPDNLMDPNPLMKAAL
jgi:nitrous oxidase accessory protein